MITEDKLDFVSIQRTATNYPVIRIKIRRLNSRQFSEETWRIDKSISHNIYSLREIKLRIKHHLTNHFMYNDQPIRYELYGTLFIDYLFELNQNLRVYVSSKQVCSKCYNKTCTCEVNLVSTEEEVYCCFCFNCFKLYRNSRE